MVTKKVQAVDNFQHRQAAFSWLMDHGYKVAKSTFYAACADGFPALNSDGSLSRKEIIRYGSSLDKSTLATPGFADKKEQLEIRKLELDVKKKENDLRKDDDRWLYREEAYAQMAAFFGTLLESIEHHLLVGIDEIVDSVDGNLSLKEQGFMICEEILGRARNEVFSLGQINRVLIKGPT